MAAIRLRHRSRIREKDVKRLNEALVEGFGFEKPPLPEDVERAEAGQDLDVLITGGHAVAFIRKTGAGEAVFPTVRLLLGNRPPRAFVTVDMGAVKFVNNGADVMSPGIVEADPQVQPGDPVWIRDERNRQPLAVGEALIPGDEMPRGEKGKAVKSLHYVGDEIWNLEV